MERASMIAQFQVEHILLTLLAMLLGLGCMELLRLILMPLGMEIPLDQIHVTWFIAGVIAFAVVTGFLGGLYPSFYLTSFRPAEVLKGKIASGFRSSRIRNALVVFQFSISIALMAGTIIVFEQLNFFLSADTGFDRENLMVINRASRLGRQLESFRNELSLLPEVAAVSASADVRYGSEDIFTSEGDDRKITLSQYKIDEFFIETTGLTVISGRGFMEENVSDKYSILINEAAASQLGWTPEEAIGKKIVYLSDEVGARPILGVVRDFNFQSLHQNVAPVIFYHIEAPVWGYDRVLMIRYKEKDLPSLIAKLERRWSELVPATPLEYSFYTEDYERQYMREKNMGTLFTLFTALSAVIAVIGLVGLVSYSAEQRKKEISVRKVFGASFMRIFVMINMQYFRLIALALVIATPLTWYLMQEWLYNYAHRVRITPFVFIITGVSELFLALFCVGFIAIRAASLNPAGTLRNQ